MRALLGVVGITAIVGLTGVWSLWAAASDYTTTLRTYTELDVVYQPDSFVWLDPEYDRGRATILVVNDSPAGATVGSLDLALRFDGDFAGANYDTFEPLFVPEGETRAVDVIFDVTANSIQQRGGTAALSLTGRVVVDFEGIDRELVLRVAQTIGTVSRVE